MTVGLGSSGKLSVWYLLCLAPEGRVPRKRCLTLFSRALPNATTKSDRSLPLHKALTGSDRQFVATFVLDVTSVAFHMGEG